MFGIKEVNDILISAITVDNRGNVSYVPYLFIETAKASESVVSSNTVIAQGGKKQKNLIAWSGENKTTLNFQDALISNKSIEFLIKGTTNLKNSIKTLRKKVAYGKTTVSELIKKDNNLSGSYFEKYYDPFSQEDRQRQILFSTTNSTIEEKPTYFDKELVFRKMKERQYDSKFDGIHVGKMFNHELQGNTIVFYCNTLEKNVENSIKIDAIFYKDELSDLIFMKYDIDENRYIVQKTYSRDTDFYSFFNIKITQYSNLNELIYEILTKYQDVDINNFFCVLNKETLLPLNDNDVIYEGEKYLIFGIFEENIQEIEEIDNNLFYSVKCIGVKRDKSTGKDTFYEIEYPKVFFEKKITLSPTSDGEPIVMDFSALVLAEPSKSEYKISLQEG